MRPMDGVSGKYHEDRDQRGEDTIERVQIIERDRKQEDDYIRSHKPIESRPGQQDLFEEFRCHRRDIYPERHRKWPVVGPGSEQDRMADPASDDCVVVYLERKRGLQEVEGLHHIGAFNRPGSRTEKWVIPDHEIVGHQRISPGQKHIDHGVAGRRPCCSRTLEASRSPKAPPIARST